MKKIVFCFDGTWNKIESQYPTNVARIAQSISRFDHDNIPQIIHYDEGVGTIEAGKLLSKIGNLASGALGLGLRQNIIEAYTFLVLNYSPGDKIYVFGFSRGAFTARSFVGMIRNCAIIPRRRLYQIREAVDLYISRAENAHPTAEDCLAFRYKNCPEVCLEADLDWLVRAFPAHDHRSKPRLAIEYLGVWDTVGALGIPNTFGLAAFLNRGFRFHDTTLSTFVKRARHAVAADERRKTFVPTMWENLDEINPPGEKLYEEMIFPGTHGAVGGGGPLRGLSDAALEWVYQGARDAGLKFDVDVYSPLYGILPDHRDQIHNISGKKSWSFKDMVMGSGLADRIFRPLKTSELHESIFRRWHDPAMKDRVDGQYRPPSLKKQWSDIAAEAPTTSVRIDPELFPGIAHSDRRVDVPKRVSKYKVQPTDTLGRIALRFMGDEKFQTVLFLHNFQVGILYEPDELHALREIEIPYYD